jgi:hypothetical protein
LDIGDPLIPISPICVEDVRLTTYERSNDLLVFLERQRARIPFDIGALRPFIGSATQKGIHRIQAWPSASPFARTKGIAIAASRLTVELRVAHADV